MAAKKKAAKTVESPQAETPVSVESSKGSDPIQPPSIGRIVTYNDPEHGLCAALVVKVWSDTCVNLHVFRPDSGCTDFRSSVLWGGAAGQWDWPKRY